MLKVIREAHTEIIEDYGIYYPTSSTGGFYFPCDENGNIKPLNPAGLENYRKCVSGEIKTIKPPYMQDNSRPVFRPKVCKCTCGKELHMYPDSEGLVYCECDRCYTTSGESVRPRHEWAEQYEDDY